MMEAQTETKIELLYQALIDSWNNQDAETFSSLFAGNGNSIGFDGSQMNGATQIKEELDKIFTQRKTASYVAIIREIRSIGTETYLLRAIAGMIPPGKTEIKPDVNAIQTLIAQKEGEEFKIAVFQNTPAAFHGRKELAESLTQELQLEAERLQKENSL